MGLELKHLAAYLPYDVKFTDGLIIYELDTENLAGVINDCKHLNNIKLHLRPLSDLTKEITVNGETFVPILSLAKASDPFYSWEISKKSLFHKSAFCHSYTGRVSFSINTDFKKLYSFNTSINGQFIQTNNPHLVYQKLLEWHFDIFGLIPAGLAIDINTLNE